MKNKLISLGLILLFIACNAKQQEDTTPSNSNEITELNSESSADEESLEPIWIYDYNQETQESEAKQLRTVDGETITGETLEKIINKSWPTVQIKFIKISNDTAFIAIPDSEVLTQQMGSAGPESFMVSTTYSFTELKGINYVSFDFEVGDHAMPGVYNRNSWDQNKNQ
jgi:hypothetical protein